MASVSFDRVTKRFDGTFGLKDFSLSIEHGEFLVLVGPSGSGKSTALRMLAGLEQVTGGRVYIGDRLVNNVPPRDRDIAMVFQSYALYPHMSVFDNMAFGLSLRHLRKDDIRARVTNAAQTLGIEPLLKRKPRQLSGGQRQRVALGRAIVRDPQVFLLDEPLSNLDAKLRVQTRAELTKLHERLGATFVYVTHDQVEAMTMATRIAVLDDGELQQVGTPQELYGLPRNMFVAGFIGSPAMNMLDARVAASGDGGLTATVGQKEIALPAAAAEKLAPYDGQPVIMGIRPEHVHDAAFVPPDIRPAIVRATVDVMELMGADVYLHLLLEGQPLLARADARTRARPGEEIDVALEIDRLYFFDPSTEQAI